MKLKPGQMWKNTKTAVQIQESDEDNLLAVTFHIESNGSLKFSDSRSFKEDQALEYLKKHKCKPTDYQLTVS